jgi:hypothetical protein
VHPPPIRSSESAVPSTELCQVPNSSSTELVKDQTFVWLIPDSCLANSVFTHFQYRTFLRFRVPLARANSRPSRNAVTRLLTRLMT